MKLAVILNAASQAYNVQTAGGRPVMIAKELLEILVCPVCKKPVIPSPAQDSLKCPQCRRVYPVRDDIPIMLVDEAKQDEP
jgi:uncharacterized protein YbaR (Trm112 family)